MESEAQGIEGESQRSRQAVVGRRTPRARTLPKLDPYVELEADQDPGTEQAGDAVSPGTQFDQLRIRLAPQGLEHLRRSELLSRIEHRLRLHGRIADGAI